jgi:hypothetical protein
MELDDSSMKRDFIDFFLVEPHQLPMHERLMNWSRWVKPGFPSWQAPMWRQGKSNSRQWHQPEPRITVDTLDGHAIEKAVFDLPTPHRDALRWCYFSGCAPRRRDYVSPMDMRRKLGVTAEGLMQLIRDGRQMLMNRSV